MAGSILYIDCRAGVAGDMFVGALLNLGEYSAVMLEAELGKLDLEGWSLSCREVVVNGFSATRFTVAVERGSRVARDLREIEDVIGRSGLSARVRTEVTGIYRRLAAAEAEAHGCSPGEVHFHEVGMVDSILDIVAACILMGELKPQEIICSPVAVGSGTVSTIHGVLPVPAPATANLLRAVPMVRGEVAQELATPTGAALVTFFADYFGPVPELEPVAVGYGAGSKKIEGGGVLRMDCLRKV